MVSEWTLVMSLSMMTTADTCTLDLSPTCLRDGILVAWQTLSDEDDELDGSCFLFFVGQDAAYLAHQDRVRIDDPESCTIDLDGATALFGKPDEGGHDHSSGDGSAQGRELMEAEIGLEVSAIVEGDSVAINVDADNFQDSSSARE